VALVATLVVTVAATGLFVSRSSAPGVDPQFASRFLWLFSGLFLLRVVGQLVVRRRGPGFLPPTEEWNLTPYRLLLPAQVAILGLMTWINIEVMREAGVAATSRSTLGKALVWLACVYAAAMAVRYVLRMVRRPGERWFGGAIPIVFHEVLAAYLFVLGTFYASN
jgi:hypothetical protein